MKELKLKCRLNKHDDLATEDGVVLNYYRFYPRICHYVLEILKIEIEPNREYIATLSLSEPETSKFYKINLKAVRLGAVEIQGIHFAIYYDTKILLREFSPDFAPVYLTIESV